jgi:hypothetical protein
MVFMSEVAQIHLVEDGSVERSISCEVERVKHPITLAITPTVVPESESVQSQSGYAA